MVFSVDFRVWSLADESPKTCVLTVVQPNTVERVDGMLNTFNQVTGLEDGKPVCAAVACHGFAIQPAIQCLPALSGVQRMDMGTFLLWRETNPERHGYSSDGLVAATIAVVIAILWRFGRRQKRLNGHGRRVYRQDSEPDVVRVSLEDWSWRHHIAGDGQRAS